MANTVLFYLTGTGNCLAAAKTLAQQLDGTTLVSVPEALAGAAPDLTGKSVGFVFPVYYGCVPKIVTRLIESLRLDGARYIFAVATFGGSYGTALEQLAGAVQKRGGALHAGFCVRMPGNYIVKYGAFPLFLQRRTLKGADKKLRAAAAVIARGEKAAFKANALNRYLAKSGENTLRTCGELGKNFHTNSRCDGCATCAKLCPVSNITMEDGHPVFGDQCEQCVACIQWCPRHAIEYGTKTENRKRYQNSGVTLKELLAHSGK